jgi:hypothetical protein
MRAFAAAQFTLTRFGAWRIAVLALSALVLLVVGTWLVTQQAMGRAAWLPCALVFLALAIWLVWAQPRTAPLSLRWDAQRWHLGPGDTAGDEPWTGDLHVAIDLGPWMLLRFKRDPTTAADGPAVTWLPVQRRGLEAHWHALRCAVYSPRPDVGVDAAPDV